MTEIAVTGASGFVGRALMKELEKRGHRARSLVRSGPADQATVVGDVGLDTDWTAALAGVNTVIHCAARVHVMQDDAADPLAAFRRVNTAGTRGLAAQAADLGVERLVFVSTIKVNGESTRYRAGASAAFTADDSPNPGDPYAVSKWEAECALREIEAETGLEVVIVRPPLVYGLGVGGNFRSLIHAVRRGWPLPFGRVENRRSLVALPNLVDLLVCCAIHPRAPGQTFLVSDDDDLATPELIRRLARAMGGSARLLPVPPAMLRLAGRMTAQSDRVERLIGSLQVDIGHTRERLGWRPPVSVDEGLQATVASV
jgi:nucleoside-diphosphate-sugar epimerase